MQTLGANLGQLRRFPYSAAATIGDLRLLLGTVVGLILAKRSCCYRECSFPFWHTGWHS
jgi:hypothetical protein